jgi:hypothetical protein
MRTSAGFTMAQLAHLRQAYFWLKFKKRLKLF